MISRRLLCIAALTASSFAFADETKIDVQAEVVHAQVGGKEVEAALVPMQAKLAPKVKYGTLKRLSTTRLSLTSKATVLPLPNSKAAELSVESFKDGVATVRVKLAPADATYKLGKEGSLYLQGGALLGGDLWLVVSRPQ